MINLTPHTKPKHWSTELCGLPWVPGADGPEAYDCWGLVRHVQSVRFGREMRKLTIGERNAPPEQWTAVRDTIQRGQWRQVADVPKYGDILLMLNDKGLPHVGVVLDLPKPCILHSMGGLEEGVPVGRVQIDPIAQLGGIGFGHLQVWRAIA